MRSRLPFVEDGFQSLFGPAAGRDGEFPTFSYIPFSDHEGIVRGLLLEGHYRTRSDNARMVPAAELQRHVRNVLAVVRSMSRRTAANSRSVEDFAAHLDGRINAFARTQSVLVRFPQRSADLETLVRDELLDQAADDARVILKGPDLLLDGKTAEVMALAIHELATNATKFGAFAHPRGGVTISWIVDTPASGRRLHFEWRESGVPLKSSDAREKGYGAELIERLVPYELGGMTSLEFPTDGVACTIEIPLGGTEASGVTITGRS